MVVKVLAVILALMMPMVFSVPVAAADQAEMEDAMDSAIERAEAYLDSIDVGEIKAQFESMGEFWQALIGGAPAVVMAVIAFVLLFMVLRKVLGR